MNWNRKVIGAVLVAALLLGACGGSGLSELAERGREVSHTRGCAACHGEDGEGDVGPGWQGLLGSTVELEGGGTALVDTDFIRRSILDPDAEIVAGATISMPVTNLSEDEVAALIAYIEEL